MRGTQTQGVWFVSEELQSGEKYTVPTKQTLYVALASICPFAHATEPHFIVSLQTADFLTETLHLSHESRTAR
ncbi:hypothetical protein QQF64_009074 [Cirrhinus molitorella]|uniref:Uncharacterized protein n=1 Tax=Cirrhinus molitorella TaxID=172907 RepID=A0ABR3M051_9TELE